MPHFLLFAIALVVVGCTRELDYRQELAWQYYDCDSAGVVKVRYPNQNRAQLRLDEDDQVLRLQRREAASGAKYLGGELVWWTHQGEGILYEASAEGSASDDGLSVRRECRRTPPQGRAS